MLPSLLLAARGKPGCFVELGALDGLSFTNTLALERCFNWTGVLIEGNPTNYAALRSSGRRAASFHSAVCQNGVGSVNMTVAAGATSGTPSTMSLAHRRRWQQDRLPTVAVPCRPLVHIMQEGGLGSAHFLSLDVEGAEAVVLETIPRLGETFALALIEWEAPRTGANTTATRQNLQRAHELLTRGGMRWDASFTIRNSRVYLSNRRLPPVMPPALLGDLEALTAKSRSERIRDGDHRTAGGASVPDSLYLRPRGAMALTTAGTMAATVPGEMATVTAGAMATAASLPAETGEVPTAATSVPLLAEAACVLGHAGALERMLLPSLLHAAAGRPGVFVEVVSWPHGLASAGTNEPAWNSRTSVLEACYNWSGLIVLDTHVHGVGQPHSSSGAALDRGRSRKGRGKKGESGRSSSSGGKQGYGISSANGRQAAAAANAAPALVRMSGRPNTRLVRVNACATPRWHPRLRRAQQRVAPPCSLAGLMRAAGLPSPGTMHFLALPSAAVIRLFGGESTAIDRQGQPYFAPPTLQPEVVLVEDWRRPVRWSRCASCRIWGGSRLCYDRRLALEGNPPMHVYTRTWRCVMTPVPKGVISCWAESAALNKEVCNKSETRDCPPFASW